MPFTDVPGVDLHDGPKPSVNEAVLQVHVMQVPVRGGNQCKVSPLQARGVMASDYGGTSDPYAVLFFEGKEQGRTAIVPKTLHPVWREVFTIKSRYRLIQHRVLTGFMQGPGTLPVCGRVRQRQILK